ncbi:MAG: hypothetical protein NZZ41_00765 [Candidatus Dojkabacteria bacterium]|nr:hypothetical protein [Candidatus Dojkabacteria bacterium]
MNEEKIELKNYSLRIYNENSYAIKNNLFNSPNILSIQIFDKKEDIVEENNLVCSLAGMCVIKDENFKIENLSSLKFTENVNYKNVGSILINFVKLKDDTFSSNMTFCLMDDKNDVNSEKKGLKKILTLENDGSFILFNDHNNKNIKSSLSSGEENLDVKIIDSNFERLKSESYVSNFFSFWTKVGKVLELSLHNCIFIILDEEVISRLEKSYFFVAIKSPFNNHLNIKSSVATLKINNDIQIFEFLETTYIEKDQYILLKIEGNKLVKEGINKISGNIKILL